MYAAGGRIGKSVCTGSREVGDKAFIQSDHVGVYLLNMGRHIIQKKLPVEKKTVSLSWSDETSVQFQNW